MAGPVRNFGSKNSKFISRAEWKVFFWCVVVATFLWFLTALNENYSSTILVRAHYANTPETKIFVRPLPEDFRVGVNAKGWELLTYYLGGRSEDISIDLKDYNRQQYILTQRLRTFVQQQLSQKITVNDIYPDTISLAVAPKMTRKVPVELNLKITYEKQFQLGSDIAFSPDSITVSGPSGYVKNVKSVTTQDVTLKDLKGETTVNIKLKKPEQANIQYNVSSVKVTIPVYQITEGTVDVPIEVMNPDYKGIRLIPEKVSITYQTTLNQYKNIDQSAFEAIVDGTRIDTTQSQPLKVQIISQPKFIYNLRLSPEYVNYVINQ